jgi:hypothetical protein
VMPIKRNVCERLVMCVYIAYNLHNYYVTY